MSVLCPFLQNICSNPYNCMLSFPFFLLVPLFWSAVDHSIFCFLFAFMFVFKIYCWNLGNLLLLQIFSNLFSFFFCFSISIHPSWHLDFNADSFDWVFNVLPRKWCLLEIFYEYYYMWCVDKSIYFAKYFDIVIKKATSVEIKLITTRINCFPFPIIFLLKSYFDMKYKVIYLKH